MEAKLKDKQAVEATVEVTVPVAEVDTEYDKVLRRISRQVRVPGFRPGRAPAGVVLKRVGEDAVLEEVRDELIERHYHSALQQFDLTPISVHFHGDRPERGREFVFEVHAYLYPEFDLPSTDEIVIDTEAPAVTDELLESTVARLQDENATLVPVERPVAEGDVVLVETVGEDGEASGSTMPIDLERVSETLAAQLVGRSIGEELELELGSGAAQDDDEDEAPVEAVLREAEEAIEAAGEELGAEDGELAEEEGEVAAAGEPEATDEGGELETDAEEIADRPATIRVRIGDVREKDKPAPDDEFAKTLGFDNWEEALGQIRASLQAQLDADAFEEQKAEFVDKLIAEAEFEVPASLLADRQQRLLANLAQDLERRGLTIQGYVADLEGRGERETFEQELREAAERGVRRDLVLERLLEVRGTELTDEEFDDAIAHLAEQEGEDVRAFRRERGSEWLDNYRFLLRREKALREAVEERVRASAQDAAPSAAPTEPAPEQDAAPDAEGGSDAAAEGAAE